MPAWLDDLLERAPTGCARKLSLPEYAEVIVWLPTPSADVVRVARPVPGLIGAVPAMVPSTKKATEPVGTLGHGVDHAVKVTDCPNADAGIGVTIVVELVACATASVPSWKVMA